VQTQDDDDTPDDGYGVFNNTAQQVSEAVTKLRNLRKHDAAGELKRHCYEHHPSNNTTL